MTGSVRIRSRVGWSSLFGLVMGLALIAGACGGAGSDDSRSEGATADPPKSGDPVRLYDASWESLWIHNAIVEYALDHGYGREVEILQVSIPLMQRSLEIGEIDVAVELWPTNIQAWWDEVVADGTVHNLGEILDSSARGFYVPRYLVEGDPERGIEALAPGLTTVSDLPDYKHLFQDPEDPDKGQLVNCVIGWTCADANRATLHAYGVSDHFNLVEPGSAAALDAAIVGPYRRGEPVVFYYWEPTWLIGTFDLIRLEMDPYNDECDSARREMIDGERELGDEAACSYINEPVFVAASDDFYQREPELVAFFERLFVGTQVHNEIAAWMHEREAEPEDAALYFFAEYEDVWRDWFDDDVAERVAAAVNAEDVLD